MPRPKKVDRPVEFKFYLPSSISMKLEIELFSEVEGKVPFGARNELIIRLISEWLQKRGVVV